MNARGFTLIELLIVVVVVVILASVLYPMVMNFKSPTAATPQNARVVERHDNTPACRGGFIVSSDGSVQTRDGIAIKC
jgi:prepilin-type N-terminal cleavage/methylation domain-containing protein